MYNSILYKAVAIFSFFFLIGKLYAQDPVHHTINNLNGLASNTVYSILQNKQGFIFIGHDKGLTRYDGIFYKNYYAPTRQGKSISNLLEINNRIWCQDFAGNFYYTQNDSLQKEQSLISSGSYIKAGCDNNNTLVTFCMDSIRYFNATTKQINKVFCSNKNLSAVSYTNNEVAYVNDNKLVSFKGLSQVSETIFSPSIPRLFFLNKINGSYYALTKNTYPYLYSFANNNCKPIFILKSGLFIQGVNIIDDEIWISTSTGAYCFNQQWQPKYNGQCFFGNNSITQIIKDREGNYWFGTLNNGIIVVSDINIRLYKFGNEAITALSSDGKNIIAGTSNNRVLGFNIANHVFSNVYKEPFNHEVLSLLFNNQNLQTLVCSDKVVVLQKNKKVREWLSGGKNVVAINADLYAMAFSGGIALIKANQKSITIPTWLQQPNITWKNNQYNLTTIATRGRFVTFSTKDSILYAATTNGLYYYSPNGSGKILYNKKEIYASQIVLDTDGVFVATYTDGLYFVTNKNVATVVPNNGISKNIYKLAKGNNALWLIGDQILQKFNSKTNKVINYTYADGLPKAEFKDITIFDSKVFLATTEGLVVFSEGLNNYNAVPPLIAVNNFFVNNTKVDYKKAMLFKHYENDIKIDFSILSFKSTSNAEQVEYKINDGAWQKIGAGVRQLSLPSLSYGKYNIQIRAFNEDAVAAQHNLQFTFEVKAPFYKTIWFIVLMLLLAIALMFVLFFIRLKNIKQKNDLLSQKIQLEQQLQQSMLASIKSQMNPHFLFNALNTIQSYIYTNDKENASQYLGKFSELTRMILEMSNKEIVSLAEEIKALKLYLELEQLRFEDKLVYQFKIDETISAETSYIPSMLIQPYVENAIKHGLLHKKNDWQLNLSFAKKDKGVAVVIDDNGIGRKRSEELNKTKSRMHQSFATNANEKRLQILNKGLEQNIFLEIIDKVDAYGNATGTSVNIFIPFVTK